MMPRPKPLEVVTLKSNPVDKTNALLSALVFLLGILVMLGIAIWLFSVMIYRTPFEATAIAAYDTNDDTELTRGVSNTFEIPGKPDFPELETPQIEQTLELAKELPSRIRSSLIELESNSDFTSIGQLGTPGGPDDRLNIPEEPKYFQRWQIQYSVKDKEAYVKRLDFFDIELGLVAKKTPRVDLVVNVGPKPTQKVSTRGKEKRLFFTHHEKDLIGYDRALARQVGIKDLDDRFVVQFYPDELAKKLMSLEETHAKEIGMPLKKVNATVFAIRETADGFEFYVKSMK